MSPEGPWPSSPNSWYSKWSSGPVPSRLPSSRMRSRKMRDCVTGQRGFLDHGDEAHEAAERAAEDADPFRVDVVERLEVGGARGDVLQVTAAPVLDVGVAPGDAVAGRAAHVRLQHHVAAVGQELRVGV